MRLPGWRRIARGVGALLHPRATAREIDEEAQHYLDEATSANIAQGLTPKDAVRAARIELGSIANVRESVRSSGWENGVETLLADLRYAVRSLRGAPGFTSIALLTLALGVGATTAIFSVVRPVLIDPLPYPAAHRIVTIAEMQADGSRNSGTFGMYRELAQRSRSLDAIAVMRSWQPTMTGPDQPERLEGQRVSADYFRVLGVAPRLGRNFEPADDRAGGPSVVIISDELWHRRLGGNPSVIGTEVALDGRPRTIIGVMPPEFENVLAPSAGVWTPLQYDMSENRAWGHHLRTVGRLRPAITVEQATLELRQLGGKVLDELRPETYAATLELTAIPLGEDLTRGVRPALLAILGGVGLVLLIACVNVTNLLLARGEQRSGEFALRAALGAGRDRLVRQLLTESLLLALVGGALGMLAATWAVRGLVALAPPELPRHDAIGVDSGAFAFGLAVTTLVGLAFGVLPAVQAARGAPRRALQRGSRRVAGARGRTRGTLIVVEVALALVLLLGSGLLLRSLQRLFAMPIGFEPSELLTMQVQTSGSRFGEDSVADRFFERALAAIQEVPGVTSAALTSQLPLSGDLDEYGVRLQASRDGHSTFRYAVSAGYLETMRIPVRRGRSLEPRDAAGASPVALINASFARRLFRGADPIGKRVEIGPPDPAYTIVGVVGDVTQASLALGQSDAVYTSLAQWPFADNAMSVVVRGSGEVAALAPAVRAAIWSVDKDQPVVRVAMMEDLLDATAADRRFALLLFEAFALGALALAAAGIYGVVSGGVVERTREIGVRSALGASRRSIVALVLRHGMGLAGLGIVIGLAGSAVATHAIASMLFSVSRLDAATYVTVTLLLASVAALACGVPAWRATRVDPASTLRAE